MSVTGEFLRDIYTEISEFGNQFFNDDYLFSLGWNAVPVIDVKNANDWKAVQTALIKQSFGHYFIGEWVRFPNAIFHHNLFEVNGSFLNDVDNASSYQEFSDFVDNYYSLPSKIIRNNRETRIYKKNFCSESKLNLYSSCMSFFNGVTGKIQNSCQSYIF